MEGSALSGSILAKVTKLMDNVPDIPSNIHANGINTEKETSLLENKDIWKDGKLVPTEDFERPISLKLII